MTNHSATEKSVRKTATRTIVNKNRISRIRTFIKKVDVAVQNNDAVQAKSSLIAAQSELMKGVSCGVINKNTASRKVKRLASHVKNIKK